MTREEAIDILRVINPPRESKRIFDEFMQARDMAIKALEESERKKGKWIRITQGAILEQYICPFCHRTVKASGVEALLSIRYPYCHCGADMRGEEV